MNTLFVIKHFLKAKHTNGHRVHSPFAYKFIQKIIFGKKKLFDYSIAENLYQELLKNKTKIEYLSLGAKQKNKKIKISSLAKSSSSKGRYGRLLHRICKIQQPKKVLELGTSLGIGTSYISSAIPSSKVITIEGIDVIYNLAKENFNKLNLNNIEAHLGKFDDILPNILESNNDIDLFFVDGNHTYLNTIKYFELIKNYPNEKKIIIFDDIDWSIDMSRAWNQIKKDPLISVSMQTMRLGIVFFDQTLTKKHYCVRY